jgi:predicted dehydrogenase
MFLNEMRNFIQSIEGNEWPVCSLDEGIYNIQLIDAVYHAGETGCKINLPEKIL